MIQLADKKYCTGCSSCMDSCPKHAISMREDREGFLFPVIDEARCVGCGLCVRRCPELAPPGCPDCSAQKAYAVISNDYRRQSSSGGAFSLLAGWVIGRGGVVFGAACDDRLAVRHIGVDSMDLLYRLRGSKYVQSEIGDCYVKVRKLLDAGRMVLFSGTPCQTAGLNSYVGSKLRERLILIDIVCHGVPSPAIWKDYLDGLETKYGKIEDACFRNKQSFGWKSHRESFVFSGKREYLGDSYTYLFYRHIMLRHSCSACPFTNVNARPSDITIGDCWGAQKYNLFDNDDKGISLVIINTDKGAKLFDHISDVCNIIPIDIANFLQPNLQYPTIPHPKRMNFEKDYVKKGFKYVLRKYGNQSLRYRIKSFIPKSLLDKIIKHIR